MELRSQTLQISIEFSIHRFEPLLVSEKLCDLLLQTLIIGNHLLHLPHELLEFALQVLNFLLLLLDFIALLGVFGLELLLGGLELLDFSFHLLDLLEQIVVLLARGPVALLEERGLLLRVLQRELQLSELLGHSLRGPGGVSELVRQVLELLRQL